VTSNFPGLYSSTGFDLLGVLARVVSRKDPRINIGPVDMSCSFLVVDARKFDFPIVYASFTFEKLTGYSNAEIVGRNCRFLQSPDGRVQLGSRRRYTDNSAVYHIKSHMVVGQECQASIINYRKGGQPFINLVTVIPIGWESDEIAYFVGFQVVCEI
ncbi:10143_t:CDS:2, partial [Entrophospora sp. SA101]